MFDFIFAIIVIGGLAYFINWQIKKRKAKRFGGGATYPSDKKK